MQKDRLYFFTFIAITIIFLGVSFTAVNYFTTISSTKLLDSQIVLTQKEVKQISSLISDQITFQTTKETIVKSIQKSIQETDSESMFISVFDWSGKIICHPKKTKIGQVIDVKNPLSSVKEAVTPSYLYKQIINKNDNPEGDFEVISMYPIGNSDWIMLAQANLDKLSEQIKELKRQYYLVFGIMGLIMVLACFLAVRIIGSTYEKKLESKNQELETELLSLSKLNTDLINYQQKVEKEEGNELDEQNLNEKGKKRILTYLRNELVPIPIETIAYVFVESTITYVVSFDGKQSTTNISLDEIYTNLNVVNFYRANRQFIIAISAIKKIVPYGNSQLKILVNPHSDIEIIISKNKAAEFKQWLNM